MIAHTQLEATFILLIIFQVKHFIADFPLQREYMLRKFSPGWDFVLPLTTHCLVHGVLTLAVTMVFNPRLWWLAPADFAIHFVMDRIKSSPRYLGRFNDLTRSGYWIALGFDQMVHHLTSLWVVWVLVTS
jgi:hypothetical protein